LLPQNPVAIYGEWARNCPDAANTMRCLGAGSARQNRTDRYAGIDNPATIARSRPSMSKLIGGRCAISQSRGQESKSCRAPQLSVRIDLDAEDRVGPGKIQLLEKIQQFGSISAAGRAMDMSYKRAWDLVDEINRICRQPAVERQSGGKNGGGAALTPFGTSLVARYRKIERDAASAVRKELAALRSDIRRPKKTASR
jgi:molybdate transport system regulatory protein